MIAIAELPVSLRMRVIGRRMTLAEADGLLQLYPDVPPDALVRHHDGIATDADMALINRTDEQRMAPLDQPPPVMAETDQERIALLERLVIMLQDQIDELRDEVQSR